MKINIKRKQNKIAILISFDTVADAFRSQYERNKFYAELHGRKQIIRKGRKRYIYRRTGLLDEVPHIKVDNSVFIIMREHLKFFERFFEQWEEKVVFQTFPVLLSSKYFKILKNKER